MGGTCSSDVNLYSQNILVEKPGGERLFGRPRIRGRYY